MGKLLRFFVYIVGALAALVVVAAIILLVVVDPNDYKDDITRFVEEKTGRNLIIDGDLGLSFFPWLALEMGPTVLTNAQGFNAENFAAVEKVNLRVKLLPLLRKEVEMDTVVLDGLVLNLEKNKAAETNWDDLVSGEKQKESEAKETGDASAPLSALAIGGIKISNARVSWDDRSTGANYVIAPFSLNTSEIAAGKPMSVDMDLQLKSNAPDINGGIKFDAVIDASESSSRIKLEDAGLSLDLKGSGLPGGELKSTFKTSATIDLEEQTFSTSQLVLTALGLSLDGSLSGKQILGDSRVLSGDFTLHKFNPEKLFESLGQPVPLTSDGSVLSSADAKLNLELKSDRLAVSDMVLNLDDTSIQGNVGVTNFAKPAIRFGLSLDEIDLDRYLAPPADSAQAAVTSSKQEGGLPVDVIRKLNLNGTVKIGAMKAYQIRTRDIDFKITAGGGRLKVFPASARMYDGTYKGNIQLVAQGRKLRVSMDETLSGIQVGGLLKDVTGKESLTGMTEASVRLTGVGETADAIRASLGGNLAFSLKDGAVKGLNLVQMIRQAKATLKGKTLEAQSEPDQTAFSTLTATAQVTNGVIENNDLSAKSPLLRVSGKGQADLSKQTINYLLTTTFVGSLEGQGGRDLDDLKGIPVPVEISGTFAKPAYKLRLDEAIKQAAGEQIKKKVDKKKEELEEKLQEKLKDKGLQDKLEGLFNR